MKREFSTELALEEAIENYMKYYYKDREYAAEMFTDDILSIGDEILDKIWPEDNDD